MVDEGGGGGTHLIEEYFLESNNTTFISGNSEYEFLISCQCEI